MSVVVLLCYPTAGLAAPGADSVSGTGVISALDFTLTVDAQSGPSGENPSGTVTLVTSPTTTLVLPVTCLAVTGNRAVIGTPANGYLSITDNGSAGDTTNSAPPDPGDSCTNPGPFLSGGELALEGDFVVVDSQPLPATKDRCKNGGWKTFATTFKNQGQCVAFVERGPKF